MISHINHTSSPHNSFVLHSILQPLALFLSFFETMDPRFVNELDGWILSLNQDEKLSLRGYGISSLLKFSRIHPRPALLRAAARCWDPKNSVFCFGLEELCPTVDEFEFLANMELHGYPVVVLPKVCFWKLMKNLCGLNKRSSKKLTPHGVIDVLALLRRFRVNNYPGNLRYEHHRLNAFLICFVAGYLLVDGHGKPDVRILEVVRQIQEGRNPIPTILAETLRGMRMRLWNPKLEVGGSPLLLQVTLDHSFQI